MRYVELVIKKNIGFFPFLRQEIQKDVDATNQKVSAAIHVNFRTHISNSDVAELHIFLSEGTISGKLDGLISQLVNTYNAELIEG